MKKISMFFALVLFSVLMTSRMFAVDFIKASNRSLEKMEKELITNISSLDESFNDRVYSVYQLGEMQSSRAVIPLLKILKTDKNEELRIIAAVSLYKIGDRRGLYAIQQAIRFDESPRVRRLCGIFYNEFLSETGQIQLAGNE